MAPALFQHLNCEFFRANYAHFPQHGQATREINLRLAIEARNSVILTLEDFEVLPIHPSTHRACLYLADVYGMARAVRELDELNRTADWKAVRAAPIVRWFSRRLRAIEKTASCID